MPENISRDVSASGPSQFFSAPSLRAPRHLLKDVEYSSGQGFNAERRHRELFDTVVDGIKRRWARERRRRKVGRAYDMALEIARVIPRGSEVLDVGCGNGFIAHHLCAMLGTSVVGIDLGNHADAAIAYARYPGAPVPVD